MGRMDDTAPNSRGKSQSHCPLMLSHYVRLGRCVQIKTSYWSQHICSCIIAGDEDQGQETYWSSVPNSMKRLSAFKAHPLSFHIFSVYLSVGCPTYVMLGFFSSMKGKQACLQRVWEWCVLYTTGWSSVRHHSLKRGSGWALPSEVLRSIPTRTVWLSLQTFWVLFHSWTKHEEC